MTKYFCLSASPSLFKLKLASSAQPPISSTPHPPSPAPLPPAPPTNSLLLHGDHDGAGYSSEG